MTTPTYPFDTTGTAASNLVSGELHTLTEVNSAPYRILIPTCAPFYVNNQLLEHIGADGTVTPLAEGVDFYNVLPYMAAQRSIGRPIYGGMAMISSLPQGTIRIRYQTLGGTWCADADHVYARLLESVFNQRMTWWDTITNVQDLFPPTEHTNDLGDLTGIPEILAKLEAIRVALLTPRAPDPSLPAHLLASGNVHHLTLSDLGLDQLANLPLATDEEVLTKTPVDKYLTLRQLLLLLP